MKIAVIGMGRMGMQIARKLAEDGHDVIAHDKVRDPIDVAVTYGVTAAYTKEDVAKAFGGEQFVLWVMIPSNLVDAELDEWMQIMPLGSTVVDGGNSDFRLTQRRAKKFEDAGLHLIDVGTSGGVWGYQNGFSMMIGGEETVFKKVEPVFKSLALPTGAYHYFGPNGAGHYVKMVHNAIEYGVMESFAEGYRLLKEGPYEGLDLAAAGEVWQHGSVITSWLNELTRQVLTESPELDGIEGVVVESGEARWALEVAKERGIELPAIQNAFNVRLQSQTGQTNFATKLLAAMRNKFGGHAINKS